MSRNTTPQDFVSVQHIRTWPSKGNRFSKAQQHLLGRFFNDEDFFKRGWDIYLYDTTHRAHFLVPLPQVLGFLAHISAETGLTKHLLDVTAKQLQHPVDPHDADPRLLGTVTDKPSFDALVAEWDLKPEDKLKSKLAEKQRRQRKQAEKRQLRRLAWRGQVRIARAVLGLDPPADDPAHLHTAAGLSPDPPVLVAIDVEAWERDSNKLTEIGIATLDCALLPSPAELAQLPPLTSIPPDQLHADPRPHTRSDAIAALLSYRHLLVADHGHLRNSQYLPDVSDRFDFGRSQWVPLRDLPSVIADHLRHTDAAGNRRKVYVVGHDVHQDLQFLRIAGYDVWNIRGVELLDTAAMYRAATGDEEARSLARVLDAVAIPYWNLHNAGNDAAYTLQALVRLADAGVGGVRAWEGAAAESSSDDEEVVVVQQKAQTEDGTPVLMDYERLVQSRCIVYRDETLGPRKRKEKRARRTGREEEERLREEVRVLEGLWAGGEQDLGWERADGGWGAEAAGVEAGKGGDEW